MGKKPEKSVILEGHFQALPDEDRAKVAQAIADLRNGLELKRGCASGLGDVSGLRLVYALGQHLNKGQSNGK